MWLLGILPNKRAFVWFMHSFYRCLKEASTLRNRETKGLLASSIKLQTSKNLLVTLVTTKRIYIFTGFILLICFPSSASIHNLFTFLDLALWLAKSRSKIHTLIYLLGLDLLFFKSLTFTRSKILVSFQICKSIFFFALENMQIFHF